MTVNPSHTIFAEKSTEREYYNTTQSNVYLKTVCAFANSHDGIIQFNLADDSTSTGTADPDQTVLKIEKQIQDSIHPQPSYDLSCHPGTGMITLHVYKGYQTPYRFQDKAYWRNGSSTVEADRYELVRLILKGRNMEYCDLPAPHQNLTFNTFSNLWNPLYPLHVSTDLFAVLGGYNQDGYTITAELLSDQNSYPGISVVKFGKTINQIETRELFEKESVLAIYQKTMDWILNLVSFEEIAEIQRTMKSRVLAEALREALLLAILQRDWNIPAPIQIEIFRDKITILWPGGVSEDMAEEEYLSSDCSILRNTQLTIAFLRLGLIKQLGSGPGHVKEACQFLGISPRFRIFANSIQVELPFIDQQQPRPDLGQVLSFLRQSGSCTRKEIERQTGFSQAKSNRILRELIEAGKIEKTGAGPSTEYRVL